MGDNDPKRPTDPARSTEKQAPPSPSAPTDSSRPASNAANPSLASRIQASASGLLNSALSSSSPSARDGISATLAASLADKGGPSGGGGGGSSGRATGGTSTLSKERLRSSSSTAHATFKSSGSSIRSGSTTSATTGWEELETWETRHGGQPGQFSFFDELDREAAVLSSQGKGKAKQRDHGPGDQQDRSSFERAWEAHSVASEQQHAHQERRSSQPQAQLHNPALDGHAVTALLADPFFDPLSQDPAELEADLDAADQPNPYLSPPPGITTTTTTTTTQLNPLSLLPGLEDMLASIPLQDQPTASASRANLDQRLTAEDLATLSSLLPPSDEPWLSLDALYHDAVYGNLLAPHVAAAKREVDERGSRRRATEREGETAVETGPGPAVRRLGLILGHLRGKMAAERAGNNSGTERQGRETV
ncbi:hypothetical protein VTO42DRAFT_4859 [Malbranchea cinnamomea]